MSKMSCLITEVKFEKGALRPISVEFQNGKLQEGQEKKLQSGVYKDRKNNAVAIVVTKEMVYAGNVNKENDFFNNFLVVHNKNTGKVRLIAMDNAILAPKITQKTSDVIDTQSSQNLNKSTMNELNKQFGSKRTKRMTEQKERLQMDIENVKEQLEETVAAIDIDESEMFQSHVVDSGQSEYRPPINRDASTKEQVYPIDQVVPERVLNGLDEEVDTIMTTDDLNDFKLVPFMKMKIEQIKFSSGDVEKIKLFLYANYLITFITTNARSVSLKKFCICESSKEVNDHILSNFSISTSTGRTRPLSMRDKAVCYILVITMIASDFELDLESISKETKIGLKKLQDMGRVLAFTSLGAKAKNVMVLKVPLPPAVSITPKNKRKR